MRGGGIGICGAYAPPAGCLLRRRRKESPSREGISSARVGSGSRDGWAGCCRARAAALLDGPYPTLWRRVGPRTRN